MINNSMVSRYIRQDKAVDLISFLENVKGFDRYYISLSLGLSYRDFNIKYYKNSFSDSERIKIYEFVNEKFYNNSLKIKY